MKAIICVFALILCVAHVYAQAAHHVCPMIECAAPGPEIANYCCPTSQYNEASQKCEIVPCHTSAATRAPGSCSQTSDCPQPMCFMAGCCPEAVCNKTAGRCELTHCPTKSPVVHFCPQMGKPCRVGECCPHLVWSNEEQRCVDENHCDAAQCSATRPCIAPRIMCAKDACCPNIECVHGKCEDVNRCHETAPQCSATKPCMQMMIACRADQCCPRIGCVNGKCVNVAECHLTHAPTSPPTEQCGPTKPCPMPDCAAPRPGQPSCCPTVTCNATTHRCDYRSSCTPPPPQCSATKPCMQMGLACRIGECCPSIGCVDGQCVDVNRCSHAQCGASKPCPVPDCAAPPPGQPSCCPTVVCNQTSWQCQLHNTCFNGVVHVASSSTSSSSSSSSVPAWGVALIVIGCVAVAVFLIAVVAVVVIKKKNASHVPPELSKPLM